MKRFTIEIAAKSITRYKATLTKVLKGKKLAQRVIANHNIKITATPRFRFFLLNLSCAPQDLQLNFINLLSQNLLKIEMAGLLQ